MIPAVHVCVLVVIFGKSMKVDGSQPVGLSEIALVVLLIK